MTIQEQTRKKNNPEKNHDERRRERQFPDTPGFKRYPQKTGQGFAPSSEAGRILREIEEMINENRWQDVISLFYPVEDKVSEIKGSSAFTDVRGKVAYALGKMGRYDEAIREFQVCIENDPENFLHHTALAYNAYHCLYAEKNREIRLGQKERERRIRLAHEHFQKTHELRPDGVTNYYRQGMLYKQIENKTYLSLSLFEKAISNWERLNEREKEARHQERKNYIKSLYQYAGALLERGQTTKAARSIRYCIEKDRDTDYIDSLYKYYTLGKIRYASKKYEDARDSLEFCLRFCQDSPKDFVLELLARTMLELDDCDRALELINKIPEKRKRPYIRWTEADALCRRKDFDKALGILAKACEKDRQSRHVTLWRMARIEYDRQSFEKTIKLCEMAMDFCRHRWGNPHADSLCLLCQSAYRLRDMEKAREALSELQAYRPNHPDINKLEKMLDG